MLLVVEIEFDHEFETWLNNLIKAKDNDPDSRLRLELALALLGVVRDLTAPPVEDSATLKRVRQCRRYPVWRLAHHYIAGVAIRILCWFPDAKTVVVVLVGGDKGPIGDIWYRSAAERAERAIERWQREQERP